MPDYDGWIGFWIKDYKNPETLTIGLWDLIDGRQEVGRKVQWTFPLAEEGVVGGGFGGEGGEDGGVVVTN